MGSIPVGSTTRPQYVVVFFYYKTQYIDLFAKHVYYWYKLCRVLANADCMLVITHKKISTKKFKNPIDMSIVMTYNGCV